MLNPVYNVQKWIEENQSMLRPPVGNKLVYEDPDIIVMMVGGPNARKDYHDHDRGPEFFFQIKGDIILKVMQEDGPVDVRINEGEMFLMPGGTTHSPQRPPDTIGLVIEIKAKHGEIDRLRWYCEGCNNMLHEASFELNNIVTELPPAMEKFFGSVENRTCNKCGMIMEKPEPMKPLD